MSRKRLIVMKFGGTSVGNAERVRQCAEIVGQAAQHDRIVVVVSAMAGVTDLIFKTIEAARHGDSAATRTHLQKFERVHRELIAQSVRSRASRRRRATFIAEVITQLQNACQALSALRSDISAQTADSLVALGERISAWALAGYLRQTGNSAEFVRAENVIVTDSNFGNAAPDMEATRKQCAQALLPLLDRGVVPVVAGYSGANAQGKPTTLGRGDRITPPPSLERPRARMRSGSGRTWTECSRPIRASVRMPLRFRRSALKKRSNWPTTAPR